MTTTLHNPTARWAFWLTIGIAVLLFAGMTLLGHGKTPVSAVLLFAIPISFGFLLAALLSARARLDVTPDGLEIHAAWEHKIYKWDQIGDVRVIRQRHSVNMIPTSVTRYLELRVDGRKVEVPAPRAGRFLGAADFHQKAEVVHRAWLSYRATVR
jgi:hypothetical protein